MVVAIEAAMAVVIIIMRERIAGIGDEAEVQTCRRAIRRA